MRVTEKGIKRNNLTWPSSEKVLVNREEEMNQYNKLADLEDLMEKYGFENVEDLDNFIQSCVNRIEYEIKKEKYL